MHQPDDRIATLEREAAAGWGRYHELRRRRVVRAALAVAEAANRARRLLGRPDGSTATGQSSPAPEPVRPAGDAPSVAHPWPLGHFYSPVPDTVALAAPRETARVWPAELPELPGIDWRAEAQVELMEEGLLGLSDPGFPAAATGDPTDYHLANPEFGHADAWALQAMLRHLRPRRLIEVGCGWSTLVTARANREHLGGTLDVTCIEPYVPDFLTGGVEGVARILPERAQDVALETFLALEQGDVLFIDSSHVVKTGSDAQFLYEQVIPRLRAGVVVHVHDIFLPRDYPRDWVLGGRGWNEQYVLRAVLLHTHGFEVLLSVAWLGETHPELWRRAGVGAGGASFWMRRV